MAVRKNRAGQPMKVVELKCPRCKRGLLVSQGQATPPIPGYVPYCWHCQQEKVNVVIEAKPYRSGPTDLHV